jgi:hypothetical protein
MRKPTKRAPNHVNQHGDFSKSVLGKSYLDQTNLESKNQKDAEIFDNAELAESAVRNASQQ